MQHAKRGSIHLVLLVLILAYAVPVRAGIDLLVLSPSQKIQTTIYNPANLTLVADSRIIPLDKGMNQIRFSWANTRIDPTSLTLAVKDASLPVFIEQMRFPPDTKNLAVWHVHAQTPCRAEIEISYFTAGISWESDYTAILSPDKSHIRLTGHVRIQNRSGEDYDNAKTRLVVGKIHLLDRIAELADQPYPHGRPKIGGFADQGQDAYARGKSLLETTPKMALQKSMPASAPKNIEKTKVSEYFLYTIEGTQSIAHGWSRQLVSFDAPAVPVKHIFVFDDRRFGTRTVQMLSFTNDIASDLGKFPLPGGGFKVFHAIDLNGGMTFAGQDKADYIPVGKQARLTLEPDPRVKVTPKIMAYAKANLRFDDQGNLSGFDDVRSMALEISNASDLPAEVEITRHMPHPDAIITDITGPGRFEKIDQIRFRFFVTLDPGTTTSIDYTITTPKGDR